MPDCFVLVFVNQLGHKYIFLFFFIICPPPELHPVLGPLEQYVTSTLDAALLFSSREGSDLGCMSDCFEEPLFL